MGPGVGSCWAIIILYLSSYLVLLSAGGRGLLFLIVGLVNSNSTDSFYESRLPCVMHRGQVQVSVFDVRDTGRTAGVYNWRVDSHVTQLAGKSLQVTADEGYGKSHAS